MTVAFLMATSACGRGDEGLSARWQAGCEVSVFMAVDVPQQQIDDIGHRLSSLMSGRHVTYVDEGAAYREYRELYKDNDDMRDILQPGEVPTSFRVDRIKPGDGAILRSTLQHAPGVDNVLIPSGCT
jgi:cell division transport system permease protein